MTATDIPIDVDLARASLQHLTVARVVNYLTYTFDSGTDEILDRSEDREKWATTPLELTQSVAVGGLASETPIVFWGGPPGEEEWYPGTLLDMLIDRLFFNIAMNYTEIVDRFLRACQ